MDWKIPLFKIAADEKDAEAVSKVVLSGVNWATGEHVQAFERELAEYAGSKYAVVFNSGTSALHALLLALGVGEGDEVIVPSFSFVSTANAVLFTGAVPVFAEIEGESYGLDPADVARKITGRTKAVMPVHIGGGACRVEDLKEVADRHGILLLEDAAEALGTTVGEKKVGTFGKAGMFSFAAPKVVSTGEGGGIVTDDRELAERLRLVRSHGRAETEDYFSWAEYLDYVQLGYGWRLSNILAALGRTQLAKIETLIERRRENASYLTDKLQDINQLSTPAEREGTRHSYQMYTVKAEDREGLRKHLNAKGIMAKVYFPCIHLTGFYRSQGYKEGDLPETEKLSAAVLTLPMYPGLSKGEMEEISEAVHEYYR